MKLRCLSDYRNDPANLRFKKGEVVEVGRVLGLFLLIDSPQSFTYVEAEEEPPLAEEPLPLATNKGKPRQTRKK